MAGRAPSPEAGSSSPGDLNLRVIFISGDGIKSRPQAGRGLGAAAPRSEATERSEGDREFRCHACPLSLSNLYMNN